MSSSFRILHVVGSMNRGGVETWLMDILRHTDHDRFRMDFCCLSGESGVLAEEIRRLGSEVYSCKFSRNFLRFNSEFSRLLAEGGYNIVHSHVHHFSGYILRLAHKMKVPVRIAHSHNTTDGRRSTLARRLYRALQTRWIRTYATALGAVSCEAGYSLFGKPGKPGSLPFQVIRNGVDLHSFEKEVDHHSIRARLGIPPQAKVIGHVGRFDTQKNHLFLLEIARELFSQRFDVWLLLIGDGPLRLRMEERAQELSIGSRVVFAGLRSDVVDLLLGAVDVFAMPSLHEGLPSALVEAQAAGLPCVISTDITRESDIVPGLVEFLPRAAGASVWAQLISRRLGSSRMDREKVFAGIRAKGFDIVDGYKMLLELYVGKQVVENPTFRTLG